MRIDVKQLEYMLGQKKEAQPKGQASVVMSGFEPRNESANVYKKPNGAKDFEEKAII